MRRLELHVAPDHLVDKAVVIRVGDALSGDVPAIAQHGDGVAKPEDFLQPVRDVDDRDGALLELPEKLEEMLALGDGERAGRLVHHDDARAGADRAGDLHELLLRGAEAADGEINVEVALDFLEHRARFAPHQVAAHDTELLRQIAETEVLRDGEVRAEGKFLMHHRDAELPRAERVGGVDGIAFEAKFAAVRVVNTGEDLSERALSGTVFTHESVALAALDREAHVVQRQHAGEALRDVAEGEVGHGGVREDRTVLRAMKQAKRNVCRARFFERVQKLARRSRNLQATTPASVTSPPRRPAPARRRDSGRARTCRRCTRRGRTSSGGRRRWA